MSIASYRRNVKRRVTGPFLPTCFPAALEQISPQNSLPPSTYVAYRKYISDLTSLPRYEREQCQEEEEEALNGIFRSLGRLTCEDVTFKRANTSVGLKRIVNRLMLDECRVVVQVSQKSWYESHSVGLLHTPDKEHFVLVSTHIPKSMQGLVTLDQVASKLALPSDRHMSRYPFNDANVTALPPAA